MGLQKEVHDLEEIAPAAVCGSVVIVRSPGVSCIRPKSEGGAQGDHACSYAWVC